MDSDRRPDFEIGSAMPVERDSTTCHLRLRRPEAVPERTTPIRMHHASTDRTYEGRGRPVPNGTAQS
jgi:hypothetical protein